MDASLLSLLNDTNAIAALATYLYLHRQNTRGMPATRLQKHVRARAVSVLAGAVLTFAFWPSSWLLASTLVVGWLVVSFTAGRLMDDLCRLRELRSEFDDFVDVE